MITRTADGTRINKPARYRQSDTNTATNSGSRPDSRPKALPKTKTKPIIKAKSKPKARLPGRGRGKGRGQPKKTYPASTIPPTFIHADISSLPYGSLAGLGAHNSLVSPQNTMPLACNSVSSLQEPSRVDGPEIPDVYDPIDDRFSDDEISECGSTGTRVVAPLSSNATGDGSARAIPTNFNAGRGSSTTNPIYFEFPTSQADYDINECSPEDPVLRCAVSSSSWFDKPPSGFLPD
ncbi:hypothetical protein FOL47_007368 [Perkinsus chesapeaki]|uniref:Uncharacterized protein n=1 Tax=Perkinsus chesapeaki TaxID=330153 RepID=A0A7J6LL12_PERCH|nr:hypothetical protein FOL47_007368 [Perkinsus chesapeaki]